MIDRAMAATGDGVARLRAWARTPEGRAFLAVIGVAVALRLALFPTTAYLTDVFTDEFTFKRHVVLIHENGLIDTFRDTNTSYIAYHYLLWLLTFPYAWLGGSFDLDANGLKWLVKTPPLLYDIALIAATYVVARAVWPRERGGVMAPVGIAALVAFHPVVVYDSAVWAQIDAAVALAGLAAIALAASGRPGWACAMLAFGLLHKPQPIIFVPVVLPLIWVHSGVRGLGRGAIAGASVMTVPLLPWLLTGDADRLVDVYRKLFTNNNGVTAITQNAWNLWWFIPFDPVPETKDTMFSIGGIAVTYQRFSLLLSLAAGALAAAYAWRRSTIVGGLIAGAYIAVAFYVLPTNTHERYMYPFVVLMAPVLLTKARFRWVYVVLSATLFLNMLLVAPPVESWMRRWDDATATHYIAGINVLVFGWFTWVLASELWAMRRTPQRDVVMADAEAT